MLFRGSCAIEDTHSQMRQRIVGFQPLKLLTRGQCPFVVPRILETHALLPRVACYRLQNRCEPPVGPLIVRICPVPKVTI